jgi:hypothetical protein
MLSFFMVFLLAGAGVLVGEDVEHRADGEALVSGVVERVAGRAPTRPS